MHPYFLFAAIHHLISSLTFSARSRSSVGRVTVDLIRRSWVRFPPRSKDFFFASCPLLGLTPSGLFMGLISTLIYTSELIPCSPFLSNEPRVTSRNRFWITGQETGFCKTHSLQKIFCLSLKENLVPSPPLYNRNVTRLQINQTLA